MRPGLRVTGNLLIACSVLGILGLLAIVLLPERGLSLGAVGRGQAGSGATTSADPPGAVAAANGASATGVASQNGASASSASGAGFAASSAATSADSSAPPPYGGPGGSVDPRAAGGASASTSAVRSAAQVPRPISRIEIAAINLAAEVVPAGLIARDGGLTWEVPAFKVGHAETTAGAGQAGNAVLLGHVTSVHSGNVFADLERVNVGEAVRVFADSTSFQYTVVSKTSVDRSDSSVLVQGDTPALSLVTCTGIWLPTIWDYTERLVVRAELVSNS